MKERTCTYLRVPRACVENVLAVAPRQVSKLRQSTGKKMKNAINQNQSTRINIFGKNIISVQVRDVYSICIKSYVTQKIFRSFSTVKNGQSLS